MIAPRIKKKISHVRPVTALTPVGLVTIAWIFGSVAGNAAELAPHDMVLLDRLTCGINASSAAHLQADGTERWRAEQLVPAGSTLDHDPAVAGGLPSVRDGVAP